MWGRAQEQRGTQERPGQAWAGRAPGTWGAGQGRRAGKGRTSGLLWVQAQACVPCPRSEPPRQPQHTDHHPTPPSPQPCLGSALPAGVRCVCGVTRSCSQTKHGAPQNSWGRRQCPRGTPRPHLAGELPFTGTTRPPQTAPPTHGGLPSLTPAFVLGQPPNLPVRPRGSLRAVRAAQGPAAWVPSQPSGSRAPRWQALQCPAQAEACAARPPPARRERRGRARPVGLMDARRPGGARGACGAHPPARRRARLRGFLGPAAGGLGWQALGGGVLDSL